MSPQSASRGPVERVYVAVSLAPVCLKNWDVCLIFGIPSWLMPLRDRSGQRWQPSGKPYVVAATKVCSRLIGVCWSLSFPVGPPPLLLRSPLLFDVSLDACLVAGSTSLSLSLFSLSLSRSLSFS